MKSVADGLRLEAREAGAPLRVTMLSCGQVDTESTRARVKDGPREADLAPVDVANTILSVLAQPAYVDVSDVTVRHADKFHG